MSVTSNREITITSSGDVEYSQPFSAAVNSSGSGQNQLVELSTGNNTITVPDNAVAVTIIKPTGNTVVLLFKYVNGDTGFPIHLTDPDSISMSSVTTFVLNAASAVTVRLIYS